MKPKSEADLKETAASAGRRLRALERNAHALNAAARAAAEIRRETIFERQRLEMEAARRKASMHSMMNHGSAEDVATRQRMLDQDAQAIAELRAREQEETAAAEAASAASQDATRNAESARQALAEWYGRHPEVRPVTFQQEVSAALAPALLSTWMTR